DEAAVASAVTPAQERMASRPGTRSPGNRVVLALSPGDLVTHDKFGLGTVVSTDGSGDQAEAKIDFGADYGVKHLVLRYAPLERWWARPAPGAPGRWSHPGAVGGRCWPGGVRGGGPGGRGSLQPPY